VTRVKIPLTISHLCPALRFVRYIDHPSDGIPVMN
jgi:hypothetical protein